MPCRSDLSCHKAFAPTQLAVGVATDSRPKARLVSGIGSPHGPADAGQLVGQRHGRLVVSDALLQRQPPLLKTAQARRINPVQLLRARQCRAGTVKEQCSQIDITALGDATEIMPEAATRFPGLGSGKLATELDRLDLIDEYKLLVHPRIAGHGPTLYESGLLSTRRLELISAKPLRSGAVAMHYRRARLTTGCNGRAAARPVAEPERYAP